MAIQYRDNYPHNIEAPQRVYVQYSQDIEFDYSTGNYPLGESFEGFIWETIYNPLPHSYGELNLSKHVWMRWRVGEKDAWTLPMRFTDSILNIETTALEQIQGTNQGRFRFKYTLDSGEIVYSEYMVITNGIDGRGILNSRIVDNNLYLDYTDDTTQNLGRVVGYNGNGFPSDLINPGDISYINDDGDITWTQFLDVLNDNLSGTSPIQYSNGVISHLNTDGNKHIPVGGTNTDVLITNGSGNYTWGQRITTIPINDSAGTGATTSLWSADKLTAMFAGVNAYGLKYSVALITDLTGIVGMISGDQAVVNEDRNVYKYNGSSWGVFYALDAAHNHNTLYYTKTELNASLGGGAVHWDNVTNKPTFYSDWTIAGNAGTTAISNGETLSIVGSGGVYTNLFGNTLTITATGTTYTEGTGIDIAGTIISHEDTSSAANSTNLNGTVLQNIVLDGFGHLTSHSSINLDTRYALISHPHSTLTRGLGLSGSNYDTSTGVTWNLDFAGTGAANTVSRSDHNHTTLATSVDNTGYAVIESGMYRLLKVKFGTDSYVGLSGLSTFSTPFSNAAYTWIGSVPSPYRPAATHTFMCRGTRWDGATLNFPLTIYSSTDALYPGQIHVGRIGDVGWTLSRIDINTMYLCLES